MFFQTFGFVLELEIEHDMNTVTISALHRRSQIATPGRKAPATPRRTPYRFGL